MVTETFGAFWFLLSLFFLDKRMTSEFHMCVTSDGQMVEVKIECNISEWYYKYIQSELKNGRII